MPMPCGAQNCFRLTFVGVVGILIGAEHVDAQDVRASTPTSVVPSFVESSTILLKASRYVQIGWLEKSDVQPYLHCFLLSRSTGILVTRDQACSFPGDRQVSNPDPARSGIHWSVSFMGGFR